ncbi:phage baseplate assembly protein V [Sphingomonas canadensis]|uniref:Phage baseplate assembly protein V n=1 Tax=Sphingomonas canadensis TaxID=1219257 RepID=A0ABW3H4V0_9SPHN|nr:phage baseplate assembly protein V [Sphingomonas canadensis]MCW3835964.1 phage baseplate assembly protein V [Sphingomonas canadensis]
MSDIARMNARIQMMIGRGTISGADADPKMQELQVEMLADETHEGVEHVEPYGFTARPKKGAEAVMLAVGGLRGHGIVLAVADRRYRITGLQEGEVSLYDDQGQQVLIGRDGIRIVSAQGVSIETEGDFSVAAEGNVSIEAAGTITLDPGGAMALKGDDITIGTGTAKDAARKDDAVDDGTDKISGGSSKVKIA